MDLMESARRERRSTWVVLIAVAAAIALLAPVAVEAATQKIKGTVKVKDTSGDDINSAKVPGMGLFDANGSSGALDVSVYAGGGGLLGTGDCTDDDVTSRPNTTTVEVSNNTIITGILLAGPDAELAVEAPSLAPIIGPGPVIKFRTTATNQNFTAALPTGLTVTPSELVFTCTAVGGGDPGNGNYVILGQ